MKTETVARMCHTINAALCQAFGDFSQPTWENAPQEQKDSVINGVVLARENPTVSPGTLHENWRVYKESEGWKYGPLKSENYKTHPNLVPFEELHPEQQAKDHIFRAVVHACFPWLSPHFLEAGHIPTPYVDLEPLSTECEGSHTDVEQVCEEIQVISESDVGSIEDVFPGEPTAQDEASGD